MAQLGRALDNLEFCSAPCHEFDSRLRPKYVKTILSAEHNKHSTGLCMMVIGLWVIEFVS